MARSTAAVVLVVIAAGCLLLAFRQRAGRNWARVVLTILALLVSYLPASNEYVSQVKRGRQPQHHQDAGDDVTESLPRLFSVERTECFRRRQPLPFPAGGAR